MRGDGDGWVIDGDGTRYWGRFGAAGLLLTAPSEEAGGRAVLLQHRAVWSHQGGTWGLPGGARDSFESARDTAVREAVEETGIDADRVTVTAEYVTHATDVGWTYTTVVAETDAQLHTVANFESAELAWVAVDKVAALPLHPGFGRSWPELRPRLGAVVEGTAGDGPVGDGRAGDGSGGAV